LNSALLGVVHCNLLFFSAVRTLDDLTLISEATARAIHRLKQEEESEQEEILSCTASTTPFIKVMMFSHFVAATHEC